MLGKHLHIDNGERIVNGMVETSNTTYKILISSGVLVGLEVS